MTTKRDGYWSCKMGHDFHAKQIQAEECDEERGIIYREGYAAALRDQKKGREPTCEVCRHSLSAHRRIWVCPKAVRAT